MIVLAVDLLLLCISMTSACTSSSLHSLLRCDEGEQSPLTAMGKRNYEEFLAIPPVPTDSTSGTGTPTLVRCIKKIKSTPVAPSSDLQKMIPDDVVGHVLGFLCSLEDRFALQCTCRQFQRLSNADEKLKPMKLGGDDATGRGGIFQDDDTIETATAKVSIFARAGNAEALYMLGMIQTYCNPNVEGGILILKRAAEEGFSRAHYVLGLVLRDSSPTEAALHMQLAARDDYLPALQETLPNRDMKIKYGELSAQQLRRYLDPICLNRLLGRNYINSTTLRELNTSHCWNPLCGRWAFKAQLHSVPRLRVSRMKMCSRCCRAKYCSKLCQVYDWRSGRHKTECQFL